MTTFNKDTSEARSFDNGAPDNGAPSDGEAGLNQAAPDGLETARPNVCLARAQFRADLSRASFVNSSLARRFWLRARPVLIVGGAVAGAYVAYRLMAPRRRALTAPWFRGVLVSSETEPQRPGQWGKFARSAGLSMASALLRGWLSRVAEVGVARDNAALSVAASLGVAQAPHA